MKRILEEAHGSPQDLCEFALLISLLVAAVPLDDPYRAVLEDFCDAQGGGVALLTLIHRSFRLSMTSDEILPQVLVFDSQGVLLNSVDKVDRSVPRAWRDPALLLDALDVVFGRRPPPGRAPTEFDQFPVSWSEKHAKITVAVLTDAVLRCSLST
jgi:hypothetical protein